MQEIRLVCRDPRRKGRLANDWLPATLENRRLVKALLDEALATHGDGSHWIETRDL